MYMCKYETTFINGTLKEIDVDKQARRFPTHGKSKCNKFCNFAACECCVYFPFQLIVQQMNRKPLNNNKTIKRLMPIADNETSLERASRFCSCLYHIHAKHQNIRTQINSICIKRFFIHSIKMLTHLNCYKIFKFIRIGMYVCICNNCVCSALNCGRASSRAKDFGDHQLVFL